MKKISLTPSFLLLSLILAGCGTESSKSTDLPVDNSLVLGDKFSLIPSKTPTNLDLSAQINSKNAHITDISVESEMAWRCNGYVESDGLSVNVELFEAKRCDYTYTAKDNLGNRSQAKLIVLPKDEIGNLLPTISKSLTINQQRVCDESSNISLKEYFGETKLANVTGFEILTRQNELGAEKIDDPTFDLDNLSLCFKKPETIGWHSFGYRLTMPNEENALFGEIFISFTEQDFTPPKISDPKFDYPCEVKLNEDTTINLQSVNFESCILDNTLTRNPFLEPNFTVSHDKDWQLTNVMSISAKVNPLNKESIYNKQFTFSSSVIGHHDVSYIVSDHYGATQIGVMRFDVSKGKKASGDLPWNDDDDVLDSGENSDDSFITTGSCDDITSDEFTCFTAPLSYVEAMEYRPVQAKENGHSTEFIDGKYQFIALWKKSDLVNKDEIFCPDLRSKPDGIKLKLPSESIMKALYKTANSKEVNGDLENPLVYAAFDAWPKSMPYFVKVDDVIKLFTFDNLSSVDAQRDDLGYVTCFDDDD